MSEAEEQAYVRGERGAWRHVILVALRELGRDDGSATQVAALVSEREGAIAALRDLCAKYGDNDWGETLNLGDIIGKHLADHLREGGGGDTGAVSVPRDVAEAALDALHSYSDCGAGDEGWQSEKQSLLIDQFEDALNVPPDKRWWYKP